MTPDKPPIRVNVERCRRQVEGLYEELVENSIMRVQEQDPAHSHGEHWQEESQPKSKFYKASKWRVRTSDDPSEENSNNGRYYYFLQQPE